ncbi:ROK family protein [Arthrobacter sp. NtRootA1]|uniref:ROK family protein n=1 Tax=Arthrobacter sp. NtRootA1 TaxID=2830983 RepID=UPI001CC6B1C2|nr:ROK family protein [Arthrobacter sp. NtRootA1]
MQTHGHDGNSGLILDPVIKGKATSRAGIARVTGLARSTVGQYVDRMITQGLLVESAEKNQGTGRPSRKLQLGDKAGVVAVVELDVTSAQIAVLDLRSTILGRSWISIAQDAQVEETTARIVSKVIDTVDDAGRKGDLRWLVLGAPSPVTTVRNVAESVSRSGYWWDNVPLSAAIALHTDVPVTVENDANLRAIAESPEARETGPMIYVHLSSGLGAGIVGADGELYRGADGVAGDIGHMRIGNRSGKLCACGRKGCVGERVTRLSVLRDVGLLHDQDQSSGMEALRLRIRQSDTAALERIREYASLTGELIATAANFYNPRTVILGGEMAYLGDEVLSGVRAGIYEHSLPIISRGLSVKLSTQRADGALIGGGQLAARKVLNKITAGP